MQQYLNIIADFVNLYVIYRPILYIYIGIAELFDY